MLNNLVEKFQAKMGLEPMTIIALLTFQLWLFKVNYKFKIYLQIKMLIKY